MEKNNKKDKLDNFKDKISEMDKKKIIITSIIIFFLLYKIIFSGGLGLFDQREKINEARNSEVNYSTDKKDGSGSYDENNKTSNQNIVTKNKENNENITIYITGAVSNPGVITLEANMRLDDALKKVGGTTKDADINRINLAMNLEDSQHYIIPYIGQDNENSNKEEVSNSGVDAMKASSQNSSDIAGTSSQAGKININSADEGQLQTITGIGPSTSKKIIEYREKEGKFSSVEDIKKISGIGDKKFESMKEYIDVK